VDVLLENAMGNGNVLGPEDLKAFMDERHIPGEIVHLEVPTLTVETAAEAVGVKPDQIVKSLLFEVGDTAVLAITCGISPVERRILASRFGVSRKKVKLADAATVLNVTGYPVGSVPPIGHSQTVPTLIDPGVLSHEEVYAGGGGGKALVRLNPKDILKYARPEILALHTLPEA
jgi:prolyl-tRNA editing enzyme YbaK/EbsC (Cys-tRNA(Pro) deacylase)